MSGNSSANIYPGAVPTADEWNRLFENKVDATAGVLTGPIVLGNMELTVPPASALHAANKQYVDTVLGESNSLPEAPADGTPYCRSNNDWVPAPTTVSASVLGDFAVPGNLTVTGTSTLIGNVQVGATSIGSYDLGVSGVLGALSIRGHNEIIVGQGQALIDMVGGTTAAGWPGISIFRGATDRTTFLRFGTGTQPRWSFEFGDGTVGGGETGTGNAGSNYWLRRYADAGTELTPAMVISRATGNVLIGGAAGALPPTDTTKLSVNGGLTATQITATDAIFNTVTAFASINGGFNGPIGFTTPNTGAFTTLTSGPLTATVGAGQFGVTVNNTTTTAPAVRLSTTNAGAPAGALHGQRSTIDRWRIVLGNTNAESTGNAGSNFEINAYTDAGAVLATPIYITRSNGNVLINSTTFTETGFKLDVAGPMRITYQSPSGLFLMQTSTGSGGTNSYVGLSSTSTTPNITVSIGTSAAATTGPSVILAVASKNRWKMGAWGTEGGGNSGSDLFVTAHDDPGSTVISTPLTIKRSTGAATFSSGVGMFATNPPTTKPTVTGAKGSNAALASLLTALASYGLITDSSTA